MYSNAKILNRYGPLSAIGIPIKLIVLSIGEIARHVTLVVGYNITRAAVGIGIFIANTYYQVIIAGVGAVRQGVATRICDRCNINMS